MPAIFNHFWVMFIVVTIANGLIWKSKSKKYIAEKPERKYGYDKLIKGWIIYGNIPWAIMGIGMLTGMTKSMDEFFNPSQKNPIVIVFFLSIIFLWIFGSYWIYFKGGAEKLVDHPGMITHTEKGNEKFEIMKVKLVWGLGILGGIFGIYMMCNQDIPI
jgi:hypothetical protein